MERILGSCVTLALVLVIGAGAAAAEEGQVTLPLDEWQGMLDEIQADARPELPALPVCRIDRRITGSFDKGLFSATLTETFEVIESRGHVRVPVLDGTVSIGEVLLDGKRTSLLKEGAMYTLGIDGPGRHTLRLEFYWGEDQDRFGRRLKFRLPDGGPTHVSVSVPEVDIEPRLASGALVRTEAQGGRTLIEGHLDSTGNLDLTWTRKLTHRSAAAVELETRVNTLFTVSEAMITGKTVVDVTVHEGETDVFELQLPPEIEVLKVEGEAVLQWRTESTGGGRLTVLLRYLVADRARISIHFQAPAAANESVELRMPLPVSGTPMTGAAGVQGPAGLKIQLEGIEGATELSARDLPPELTDLTSSPLLFGFAFTGTPTISIAVARQAQVSLTSTLIEELQASSVLVEDGTEVTKVKIRIRNNTREYLTLHLPKKAVLTHSLIDGVPVRPAISTVDGREALLFPLRQSERIEEGRARTHTVRPGETLSDIANFYYSDPTQWSTVLEANPSQLYSANSVTTGQLLQIPALQGVAVEESSFVIELAYKSKREPLGDLGHLELELPELDVDTMRVTWHLYLPSSLNALAFDANLTQYSAIRYDPFRRVLDFLDRALWIQSAWAGGYENILTQRKAIYRNERDQRRRGEIVRATFPLVGERYRFKRILLGRETPRISVTYVARTASQFAHYGALIAAFLITLFVLRSPRRVRSWIVAAVALAGLLVLGHYFLGVHRRVVWGIDLALIVALLRLRAGPIWSRLKELVYSPWLALELLTFRNLFFAIGLLTVLSLLLAFPLLISSAAAVLLALWWRRQSRLAGEEVRHA